MDLNLEPQISSNELELEYVKAEYLSAGRNQEYSLGGSKCKKKLIYFRKG